MIGEAFSAQEQALIEFAIGSNPFSIDININTTLFLVLFFDFNLFLDESHITR